MGPEVSHPHALTLRMWVALSLAGQGNGLGTLTTSEGAGRGEMVSTEELNTSESDAKPGLLHHWRAHREKVAKNPALDMTYRIVIGVVGFVVLVVGIICIPFVGPGWLIVFAGLGILASEFEFAHRLLHWVKKQYDRVMEWFLAQNWLIRGIAAVLTFVVTVAALWLLGSFSLVGGWFGLDWPWLERPFFK